MRDVCKWLVVQSHVTAPCFGCVRFSGRGGQAPLTVCGSRGLFPASPETTVTNINPSVVQLVLKTYTASEFRAIAKQLRDSADLLESIADEMSKRKMRNFPCEMRRLDGAAREAMKRSSTIKTNFDNHLLDSR